MNDCGCRAHYGTDACDLTKFYCPRSEMKQKQFEIKTPYPTSEEVKALYRTASSGATRDLNDEKLVYDKFQHPLVVEEFARYMHGKRAMPDGTKRDGDNWWRGFPRVWLLESMHRHYMDVWFHVTGFENHAAEPLLTALCGLFFNVQALMLEVILGRHIEEVDDE